MPTHTFEGHPLRTLYDNGIPCWLDADIGACLGYVGSTQFSQVLDDLDRKDGTPLYALVKTLATSADGQGTKGRAKVVYFEEGLRRVLASGRIRRRTHKAAAERLSAFLESTVFAAPKSHASPFTAEVWAKAIIVFKGKKLLTGSLFERAALLRASPSEIVLGFLPGSFEGTHARDPEKRTALEEFLLVHLGRPVTVTIEDLPGELLAPAPRPVLVEVLPPVPSVPPSAEQSPEEILAVLFEGKRLRLTPEKPARVSLLDVLAAVGYANPSDALEKLKGQHPEVLAESENFAFSGKGSRPTPVVSKRTLLKLLNVATAPKLLPFKEWSARTLERYLDGDTTLAQEVIERGGVKAVRPQLGELSPEVRLARAGFLQLAADAVAAFVPEKSLASLRIMAAEEATGRDLTTWKPAIEEGCTYTPTTIAARLGVSLVLVGRVATSLGLKGPNGEGAPGLSEAYQNTANDGTRTVVCYRYSLRAVQQIEAAISRALPQGGGAS
jgi:prophage antirepressor-like protein